MPSNKLLQHASAPLATLLFVLAYGFPSAYVAAHTTTPPREIFEQVQLLADDVRELRTEVHITTPWPRIGPEERRTLSDVFQIALQVLGKINRYRTDVVKTGAIYIPRFPGRAITANELYSVIIRLRQELRLLNKRKERKAQKEVLTVTITPNHAYAVLAEISIALDEALGLRGFTPSDAYAQSLRVLELVRFLRYSQNLPMNVPKPLRTSGTLPNHALATVYRLLEHIRQAEKNLWMKPIAVLSKAPRRVITPVDVFDAFNVSLFELQRIKFRLGLERDFKIPPRQEGKDPHDVIQNTEWALRLMPDFQLGHPLRQFDRKALGKTPNHVYSVTEFILQRLREYRRRRGIQTAPRKVQIIRGVQHRHVYVKGLEILEKVDVIRRRHNLGAITVQQLPMRVITPMEMFDLVLRLDEELDILFRQDGMTSRLWVTATRINEFENKTPSEVFSNMWRISLLLDTIIGSEGSAPAHVFRDAVSIRENIALIARALGEPSIKRRQENSELKPGIKLRDVFSEVARIMKLVLKAKRRAGMFGLKDISISPGDTIAPTDVHNYVHIVSAELTELKLFLSIFATPERPALEMGKTLADVFRILKEAEDKLAALLHLDD